MVHVRSVAGRELSFIVSGKLWRNSLIMQDEQTGTLWSHVTGEALEGELAGKKLEILPAVQTTWKKWLAAHPSTTALAKERPVAGSRYEDYAADPKRAGLFRTQRNLRKLGAKELVFGVSFGERSAAVTAGALEKRQIVRLNLGETSAWAVQLPDGGAAAFAGTVGGRPLELKLEKGRLSAPSVGGAWSVADGQPLEESRISSPLEPLPVQLSYWFAWISFYPDSALVR